MIEVNTEFGRIAVSTTGNKHDITLHSYDFVDQIALGWVVSNLDQNSHPATQLILSKYNTVLLTILRFESKCGMFQGIPLSNPFRDAVLRMQIENTGQTFSVRSFIEEYESTNTWTTYPKEGETFQIYPEYASDHALFLTPYGTHRLRQIDTYSFEVVKIKDNTEKILGLIRVPYNNIATEIELTAIIQMLDIMMADTMDIIWRKTHETTKRTSEAVKYMFNYDKLRRAMRKKGVQ